MTREEAIERFSNNAEYERTHGNLQGCLEFRQLAEWLVELKELKEHTEPCEDCVSMTQWIPVENEFPDDGVEVLVCNSIGEIIMADGFYDMGLHDFIWCVGGWGEVIAWQPLPKPYKEEGE